VDFAIEEFHTKITEEEHGGRVDLLCIFFMCIFFVDFVLKDFHAEAQKKCIVLTIN
jgi:hypothetical protein